MRPPFNLQAVEDATRILLPLGHKVMHTHRYGRSDAAHVQVILDAMRPEHGAMVLDVGCGVGEVSRLMSTIRRDLRFLLVNVSPLQASLCPLSMDVMVMDFHDSALSRVADCVMFNSALCQMDAAVALARAHAALRDNGVLFLNEMVAEQANDELEELLAARVTPAAELRAQVECAGFEIQSETYPDWQDDAFQSLLEAGGKSQLLNGVRPIFLRAVKCAR